MIQMNVNGIYEDIMTRNDMYMYMFTNFAPVFNEYLISHYGITEEQFKNILKSAAPEEFI